MAAFLLGALYTLTHLILTSTFDLDTIIVHILQIEKETQRGQVTFPTSQACEGQSQDSAPGSLNLYIRP